MQQDGTTGVYRKRHDKVAGIVHCSLCVKCGLSDSEQWYRHRPYGLTSERDGESQKRLGCQYPDDYVIEHRRPDIVVIENENKSALLIDIAVPGDTRVNE